MKEVWEIYMHIFPNGKKYIGITSQGAERRWRPNGEGYKEQGLINNAINKYGWDNVEHKVLRTVNTKEEAEEIEQMLISEYMTNKRQYGYNIRAGGQCSKGHRLSEETRAKMSRSRSGAKNWNYGRHLTDEVKAKLSAAHKGKCNIEAIRRGAKKRMGKNAFNARKVMCYDMDGSFIAQYDSLADGGRAQGVKPQDVYACCVGRQKSTHGRRWAYAD